MSYSFEDIWSLNLTELQKKRKQTTHDYGTLYNKFLRLDSVLQEKRQKLSGLNSEIALIDRKLKDGRNSNFVLNRKSTEMKDALNLLKGAVEKKESALFELNSRKTKLEDRIKELTQKILECSQQLSNIARTNNINQKKVVELKKEKTILSEEISRFLSATSIERDDFERKAQELNNTFVVSLTERSDVKNTLAAIQNKITDTLANIDMFKNQIEHVKEIKNLRDNIMEQANEQRSFGVKYSELQIELRNKKGQLDSVVSRMQIQNSQLASISDDNLLKIDKALSELSQHKNGVETLSEQRSTALEDILEIMIEKAVLEENKDDIWQRVEMLESGLLEFAR